MMNKKKQKISLILSATLLLTSVPIMQYAISAETQVELQAANESNSVIEFDDSYSFDKVTLSYKDPATGELKIAFSADGETYGEPKTVTFDDETDASVVLDDVLTAKFMKVVEDSEDLGLPKLKLSKLKRYEADKDNVGAGTRGTAEKFDPMWSPGDNNFAQWFDGIYDDKDNLINVNGASSTGLYHDALKKGYTEKKEDAMIELTFNFDESKDFAYAVLYMDSKNTADFQVRKLNSAGKYDILSTLTKDENFGKQDTMSIDGKDKKLEVYKITAPINAITDSFNIYWYNFHDYITDNGTGKENARVDIPEMAFYYYHPEYESGFVLHDGKEHELPADTEPFARIVGDLPEDMWYVGITDGEDKNEVRFDKKDGSVGYLAADGKSHQIKTIKIQGYNMQNVSSAKFPESIELYGEAIDLAKAAYDKATDKAHPDCVTFEQATKADFGEDPRKEYMDPANETGVAALFDGDERYKSYIPYHTFVAADPDRLTIKDNGSITVDLGAKSIIDSVSYYAGPQYTPKKYTVLVSDDKNNFSDENPALEKTYELLEGRLSPFTTPDQFYCSMHEDHALEKYVSGRYVKIANDGVLKPQGPELKIEYKGENVVDTMMKNDAMLNKSVILVKELKIMGAPLVDTITITTEGGSGNGIVDGNEQGGEQE